MGDAERIAVARGGVLGGLAALQGLGDLLRSRRVGTKAIERTLPDVAEGLAEMELAIADLFDAISPPFAAAPPIATHAKTLVAGLRADLVSGHLDARRRIGLESTLFTALRDLEAALAVGELAAQCSSPRPIALDLAEAIRHRWGAGVRAGERETALLVEASGAGSATCDPKILFSLLELMTSSVAATGVVTPRVVATAAKSRVAIRIDDASAHQAVTMTARAYVCSPDKAELAIEAAARAGIEVAIEDSGRAVTMTF